ncbi:NUDIX domain-containing protein [Patescibacteria group bacterium]|nr:NUDIX domain-containing protein [Patescibacteria group bacterium]
MFINNDNESRTEDINNRFPKGVEVVVSATIENNDGKILLIQSSKWFNKWMMPAGHIEPGERMVEALKREIKEETGLDIEPKENLSFEELVNSKDFHRPAHFIYFDFLCKLKDGDEIELDKREINDYVWVTPEEGLKMDLAESFSETIKKYIKYKSKFSC